ncbi:uncharacterized protein LOC106173888 [Lingula anatina]|uniref:Uncharacterized protein LOC106173888 n=1 Tax=Lingula anatina TaxID=7574 RepID=A0A1S3JJW2_LINAN|nr:uncharacterized protein LOC106173888 [Lingula anatina]|eukprot:XP_013410667.1 uncharacterized protein LOC106173888 [Lingula anatina]
MSGARRAAVMGSSTQMTKSAGTRFSSPGTAKRRLLFTSKLYNGKSFFLDLDGYSKLAKLEEDVVRLGGRIERFLSREVNFVVTNKTTECGVNGSPVEPTKTPSPSSVDGSKAPVISRGMALVLKSTSTRRSSAGRNDVLTNAKMWGVPILSLQEVLKKIKDENKKATNTKSKNIEDSFKWIDENDYTYFKGDFLKIEDTQENLRPVYSTFADFPYIDLENDVVFGKNEQSMSKVPATVQNSKSTCTTPRAITTPRRALAVKQAASIGKQRGYCECCDVWYRCLDDHLVSGGHRRYADNNNNYNRLDDVIDSFPSFDEFLTVCLESENPDSSADSEAAKKLVDESSNDATECAVIQAEKNNVVLSEPQSKTDDGVVESVELNDGIQEQKVLAVAAQAEERVCDVAKSINENECGTYDVQTVENKCFSPRGGTLSANDDIQPTNVKDCINKIFDVPVPLPENHQRATEIKSKTSEGEIDIGFTSSSHREELTKLSDSSIDQLPSAHITSPEQDVIDPYEFHSETDEANLWKISRRNSTKLIFHKNGPVIDEKNWNDVYQSPPAGCSFVDLEDDVFNDSVADRGADSVSMALSSDSSLPGVKMDSTNNVLSSDDSLPSDQIDSSPDAQMSDDIASLEAVDELRESMFTAKRHVSLPTNNFQWSVKSEENSGHLKLKFCKIVVTPISQPYDSERVKWRVTRSGNCKLIFRSDSCKKRASHKHGMRTSSRSRQLKYSSFEGMD